jgi:hypothetical protein
LSTVDSANEALWGGAAVESDIRYYRRRACEEMAAATRAVTEAARDRRLQLVDLYVERLKALNAPSPFDDQSMSGMIRPSSAGSAFGWREARRN